MGLCIALPIRSVSNCNVNKLAKESHEDRCALAERGATDGATLVDRRCTVPHTFRHRQSRCVRWPARITRSTCLNCGGRSPANTYTLTWRRSRPPGVDRAVPRKPQVGGASALSPTCHGHAVPRSSRPNARLARVSDLQAQPRSRLQPSSSRAAQQRASFASLLYLFNSLQRKVLLQLASGQGW